MLIIHSMLGMILMEAMPPKSSLSTESFHFICVLTFDREEFDFEHAGECLADGHGATYVMCCDMA